jgi:hypothetical protein
MAAAVTPNLYITDSLDGSDLGWQCVYTNWATEAKKALEDGKTVAVPDEDVAHLTLLLLGLSAEEADRRVDIALYGPSAIGEVDRNRPVPLAPGAAPL